MSSSVLHAFRRLAASLLMMWATLLAPTLQAQSVLEDTALQVAPEDCAFFCTLLKNAEQFEILRNSKAYAVVKQNPFVQLGLFQFQQQLQQNEDGRQFLEQLKQPENQQLIALLKDAISHEVFLYGDSGFAQQLAMLNRLNSINRTAQLEALTTGESQNEVLQRKMTEAFLQHAEDLGVPQTVIGLKITDHQAALDQLGRLETLAGQLLEDQPELRERLERKTIGEGEYLVWNLDGSLIPWENIEEQDVEIDPEQKEKVIQRIKEMTLTIAVGVYDDYLIVSIAEDEEHLAQLGEGSNLASNPELAPLKEHTDKRITSVSYISREFLEAAGNAQGQLEDLQNMVEQTLPLAELEEEQEEKVLALVEDLFEEGQQEIPEQASIMSFSYLTPRGYEQLSYNYAENSALDASAALSIIDHVGGTPILWAAVHPKENEELNEEEVAEWFGRLFEVGNEIALSKLDEDERPVYEQLRDSLVPLLKRVGTVYNEQLHPALKDCQVAFVMDAALKLAQPHAAMAPADEPLPVPELALVISVQDAQLVRRAGEELFQIAQEAMNAIREAAPEEVPEITIPAPQRAEEGGMEVFSYPLPPAAGLDPELAPNVGLSQDTLVLSLSPTTSKRLLTNTALTREGVLARTNEPLAAAASLNFAAFIDALRPWIVYGVQQSGNEQTAVLIQAQVDGVLDLLKCFRGSHSVTYRGDDAWITHTEMLFSDLP